MVVVIDECLDLGFRITWQKVVLEQDTVLQSLVPTFDFALSLGMVRRTSAMLHVLDHNLMLLKPNPTHPPHLGFSGSCRVSMK